MDLINFFKKIPKKKTDIIFFDIDDTLLRPFTNEPIKPVLEFYNYLVKNSYNIAIITARLYFEDNVKHTINDLKSIGIEQNSYKYLILRPDIFNDVKEYKTLARKNILDNGFTPLMSLGDMYWDVGEYGGIGVIILQEN